jgi:HK97 family phage prohead protease
MTNLTHKTLEAKATTTELGEFTAIAAAYSVDRGNERIIPGAFKSTITSWQASGKQIPLHWDHSGDPHDIIGTVDPSSMEETELGLKVAGRLDLDTSDVAREAWRSMKANRVALSFGYLVTDGGEAKDGVYELKSVDLFEISVTPAPMNPDTRFLALKSVTEMGRGELREELSLLRKRLDEIESALEEPPPTEGQDARAQGDQPSPQASDPEVVRYELERLNALA